MPITSKSFDNDIRDRLLTFPTFRAVPVGMTAYTPCVPILLNKGHARVEWIAALRTEEVARMPFSSASYNHLPFNGSLARLASGTEQLMEVKVAVKS